MTCQNPIYIAAQRRPFIAQRVDAPSILAPPDLWISCTVAVRLQQKEASHHPLRAEAKKANFLLAGDTVCLCFPHAHRTRRRPL